MKSSSTSTARSLWDSMTRTARRANEPTHGFHESSLELQQGLEVRETPMANLPIELVRTLIARRTAS